MGVDVWVNAFTMPFLRADSGPWRKMSRAWPPVSMITSSSDTTCPSHQESGWGTAEARQEKVTVEVLERVLLPVEAGVFIEHNYHYFCQYCPRWEGFRRGAALRSKCQTSWPSPTTTLDRKRTSKRRHHVWWVERFVLLFVSVHGCMGMDVWVNVFRMPLLCADWNMEKDV